MAERWPDFTPVNLITGFLGSGKTTLLRRMLSDPELAETAVLINEFGEIGLDHYLLERIDETMVLLQSGCLCCTVRGELSDAMRDLEARRMRGQVPAFNRMVIESTGLADPFPVLSTIKSDPVLRHHFRPGAVITTLDAVNGAAQIETYVESARQVAVADRIVLTKTDLTGADGIGRVTALARRINPDAPVIDGSDVDLDIAALIADAQAAGMASDRPSGGFFCDALTVGQAAHEGLQATIRSFVLSFDTAIDWTRFGVWLTMLINRHGGQILRIKGMLDIDGEDNPVAIHAVQHLVHTPVHMDRWPSPQRHSTIVFIVDGLDPDAIRRSFAVFMGVGTG